MPHFKAIIDTVVSEEVIVEASSITEAERLIKRDSNLVHVLLETRNEFKIREDSLQEIDEAQRRR